MCQLWALHVVIKRQFFLHLLIKLTLTQISDYRFIFWSSLLSKLF